MSNLAAITPIFRAVEPEIINGFRSLWESPELGNMEFLASRHLCSWLEHRGFCVERGVGGVPTAFRAEYGSGTPYIGLLAEYDALPGIDNDAVPFRKRRWLAAGHGCGHNLIGPANCGAAIIAAMTAKQKGLPGTIVVIGSPAEEIVWGKIALLERGIFDGLDAVFTSHGDYQNGAISRACQSVASGEVIFFGEAGHGGTVNRRNALDAAELAVQSIERLRAHHFPDVYLEHVLRSGGLIPNVTPDEARVWFTARGTDYKRTREVFDFAIQIAGRAAEMAGVKAKHQFISATRGYLANDILAGTLLDALNQVGPPAWSNDDLAFMRALAMACRPDGRFTLDRGIALYTEGVDPYGQDDGEVSWRFPLGRINWAFPREVPLHHWALTALSGHAAAYAGPLMAVKALALAILRLLENISVLDDAKAELSRRVGGQDLGSVACGAWKTMRQTPAAFWDASWIE